MCLTIKILIGHPFIPYEPFVRVEEKEDISQTKPHVTVLFDFHEEKVALCHYAKEHEVSFALLVKDEREVMLAAALGASFIVCDKALVKEAQKFADDYLFDAKILLLSKEETDIAFAAQNSIDGILFEKGIKNGNR